ncbi:hypothetical protein OG2516_18745 [Oceanicola granulosus HTCC2516]|uniref:ADP-ribosylglycohydrolase family protein n=1 Tax=Oceanicola granulosus (strain ATCC BAA-861 / DSM 15982 / KCTC 12143 / HTCC2516) TaxID=314256 RepID=Q2CHA7_OCEGH|nr:ADP-ribosylglycohydrolase family protein [Oceanicola granulosus]EAR52132.1 hypothetical protein OG2516_18745 [Oceanicola granulosus HTCC2516]
MSLPNDHLERVYAGVLGKLIGVYLGRPFENWRYERILRELGPITYYVHDRLGDPLVVTDDDVGGTFTFPRALEDHRLSTDLTAEEIGETWRNYLVEERAILWWGGAGNSTEHTAWLNLDKGIKAPASGSIETNGAAVAEQIGAQIFIDGWALVSPGNPEQAARLARAAGSVSHDGESVHAAVLWAAMEAEAFVSRDVDHLLDTGLSFIPEDCLIARLVADLRGWVAASNEDWEATRQKVEDKYGYQHYPGNCHVVPNHALMIMALLHAPDDFQRGQMIVNTSGWDTDCNAGNLGCLQGIMHGLAGLEAGPDWRGPVADRLLISTADGGNAITDAVRIARWLTDLGRQLAGEAPLPAPKDGARFHFTLPGSVQGFRAQSGDAALAQLRVHGTGEALALDLEALAQGREAAATTPVFSPPEVKKMRTYDLLASPLVYPGQRLTARLKAERLSGTVEARLRVRHYDGSDRLVALDAPEPTLLRSGETVDLAWTLPDLGGQPIAEVGVVLTTPTGRAAGRVLLDRMGWDGAPDVTFRRPAEGGDFWWRAWVNGASFFSKHFQQDIRISQARGAGMILQGTRDWTDYRVEADMMWHLGPVGGLVFRAQGLRRHYAARLTGAGTLQLVRRRDDEETVLDETPCRIDLETPFQLVVRADGDRLSATIGDHSVSATDATYAGGAMGPLVQEGAVSATRIHVGAV